MFKYYGIVCLLQVLWGALFLPFRPEQSAGRACPGCSENLILVFAASGVLLFSNVFALIEKIIVRSGWDANVTRIDINP